MMVRVTVRVMVRVVADPLEKAPHGYVFAFFCDRGVAAPATEAVYRGSCKRMATFWALFVADPLQNDPYGYVLAHFCDRAIAAPATGGLY